MKLNVAVPVSITVDGPFITRYAPGTDKAEEVHAYRPRVTIAGIPAVGQRDFLFSARGAILLPLLESEYSTPVRAESQAKRAVRKWAKEQRGIAR